ncbi:YciI family protein [Rathayibacter soli]|uniref:YciI family protein n=1 Tax=Rathayibacter soli TaxID=3144168 RepID=UPI0027E542AD|nr:YciI family protein [Glaciibacter superstes]
MKYMLLLKADEATESGRQPSNEEIAAMGRYNEELINDGVLLAGEGLHSSSEGARVDFDGDERAVTDGPFAETKELIAGFWILQAGSLDEAVERARRVPLRSGRIEVRQVYDVSEFDQENEFVQKELRWREEHGESRTA